MSVHFVLNFQFVKCSPAAHSNHNTVEEASEVTQKRAVYWAEGPAVGIPWSNVESCLQVPGCVVNCSM